MTTRRAACSCGQLTIETQGEPIRISVCHCLACQRRTGSALGVQARFDAAAVRIEGRASSFTRTADSGHNVTFHFCPECGATVHYRLAQFPNVIAVPVGAFADPTFPAPRFSVYESRRHSWLGIDGDLEHHS
jgi:hypothetical protein